MMDLMQLPKVYDPKEYESKIYVLWEKAGAFKPVNRGGEDNYSIVLPPPNANGDLHVGHSFMFALQDVVIRYHRMKGDKTLWLPGADHAGFETQVVYEKQLAKLGKSRFDLKREELYDQIWDFVAKNRTNYEGQFRRLGASVDWDSYVYTLDDKIIKQAYSTFKKMWDEGLIYRGERLVNYCTHHRTGFADIEVAYEDAETPLYYMKYGPFTLATTRPETKFGDTAVAVHPEDKRYSQYVGKVVTVEGVNGPFEVQVIADDFVDQNFGTGVVKITPAHSFDDWEVAQRHNLPSKRVIDHDGTLNELTGPYRGMTIMDGRKAVVEALEAKGLLVKVDKHYKNRVGKCYKCGTVIEPMLMEQWFIDMKPLAKPAIEALKAKKITFYPDSKRTQLITYLEGLRDWNISRQIAWGIPIPAFQNVDDPDDWIFETDVKQEILEVNGKNYRRDPDVFDTWFSSSSWPYATLGYPDQPDSKDFYPNSLMETGGEILYPWVSRMIMLGLYVTGEIPFENVYIHGYVLAEDGAKMSKSIGNVVDPGGIVDKYGSDALRMGLIAGRAPAINRGFDPRKVEDGRNFCNKLWNVARFVEDKVGSSYKVGNTPKPQTVADEWILAQLDNAISSVSKYLEQYRFAEAYDHVYHLLWDDFADWYVETSKVSLNKDVLAYGLETILKLTHPFAPFVSEAIWQSLKWKDGLLITSPWPKTIPTSTKQAKDFSKLQALITEVRNLVATAGLSKPPLFFTKNALLSSQQDLVQKLAKLASVTEVSSGVGLKLTTPGFEAWLDVDAATLKKIAEQLANKLETEQGSVKQLEGRLANKSYVANAPQKLVDETKQQLELARARVEALKTEINRFK